MRNIILYIASSLNGKIAKNDGTVDWLQEIPNPQEDDHGYAQFYESIDTTIQGYNTYRQIRSWGIEFPYIGKKNYVFTTKSNPEPFEHVEFVHENHIDFVKQLKRQSGGNIWLIGGGMVNGMLLEEGLIDELLVFVMPIVLDDGIDLFQTLEVDHLLKLQGVQSYPSGAVCLTYRLP